jgi:hypothetical protein
MKSLDYQRERNKTGLYRNESYGAGDLYYNTAWSNALLCYNWLMNRGDIWMWNWLNLGRQIRSSCNKLWTNCCEWQPIICSRHWLREPNVLPGILLASVVRPESVYGEIQARFHGTLLSVRIGQKFVVVRFEVFTAVTTNNTVFWDVTPCVSCMGRYFDSVL